MEIDKTASLYCSLSLNHGKISDQYSLGLPLRTHVSGGNSQDSPHMTFLCSDVPWRLSVYPFLSLLCYPQKQCKKPVKMLMLKSQGLFYEVQILVQYGLRVFLRSSTTLPHIMFSTIKPCKLPRVSQSLTKGQSDVSHSSLQLHFFFIFPYALIGIWFKHC